MIRFLIGLLIILQTLNADEIRPAYLELTQQNETSYKVLWKKPAQAEGKKPFLLEPVFPKSSQIKGLKSITRIDNTLLETYVIEDNTSLINKPMSIKGLQSTSSDVLVRIQYIDGATEFIRVLPENNQFVLEHQIGFLHMASTYFILGVEHILLGFDHLLFVLALLLLVKKIRMLIWTITAFTLAHSITLILASMDIIQLSGRAVEAVIALSIVFVSAEVVYAMRGRQHLSIRYPWLVALGFGLIHGLGFAGALKEIGLPQTDIVPALIFFNVGVEIGQLIFVVITLLLIWVFKPLLTKYLYTIKMGVTYIIGIIATLWFLERVLVI